MKNKLNDFILCVVSIASGWFLGCLFCLLLLLLLGGWGSFIRGLQIPFCCDDGRNLILISIGMVSVYLLPMLLRTFMSERESMFREYITLACCSTFFCLIVTPSLHSHCYYSKELSARYALNAIVATQEEFYRSSNPHGYAWSLEKLQSAVSLRAYIIEPLQAMVKRAIDDGYEINVKAWGFVCSIGDLKDNERAKCISGENNLCQIHHAIGSYRHWSAELHPEIYQKKSFFVVWPTRYSFYIDDEEDSISWGDVGGMPGIKGMSNLDDLSSLAMSNGR